MKKYINKVAQTAFVIIACAIGFTSCNKELPLATPILYPKSGDTTIFGGLTRDTSLSFYRAAVIKAGFTTLLNNDSTLFTAFVPNNAAFRANGITSIGTVNSLPITLLGGLVGYSLIPGEQFVDTITSVTTAFPNVQLPSYITIASLPGTTIPINVTIFPSKRPNGFWANNIPVVASNQRFRNGIIHVVSNLVIPPPLLPSPPTLSYTLQTTPNLSIFYAVIKRGDQGQTGLNAIDTALQNFFANLTVFAPSNTAMKAFLSPIFSLPITAPDASFVGAVYAFLPVPNARGIAAYHIMPYRAFSVNYPSAAAATFPTLLTPSAPTETVKVQSTIFGGFGVALAITGVNNTTPAIATLATGLDTHYINGILDVIDQMLKP